MLTQERLKELINYDPETGIFTWKERQGNPPGWRKKLAGTEAGRVMKRRIPYRQITVDDKQYYAHRLAFLYMTGKWPKSYVDHIDQDGLNNRWDNLRAATNMQNQWNAGPNAANSTGFKGVCYAKKQKKFQASIKVRGRIQYLGQYRTAEEAYAAYCGAARLIHGEFARLE